VPTQLFERGEFMKDDALLKQPSRWIPLAMSFAALVLLLGYAGIFGIAHHEDEGAPANRGILCNQAAAKETRAITVRSGASGGCMDHSTRCGHLV
jgi:hypothetical protein